MIYWFISFQDSGESNNNTITIEIKGSTERIMENENIDKTKDKSQTNNQETTFLLLETKGNRNYWIYNRAFGKKNSKTFTWEY